MKNIRTSYKMDHCTLFRPVYNYIKINKLSEFQRTDSNNNFNFFE